MTKSHHALEKQQWQDNSRKLISLLKKRECIILGSDLGSHPSQQDTLEYD